MVVMVGQVDVREVGWLFFFWGGGVGMVDFESFTCDLEGFMIPVTCF